MKTATPATPVDLTYVWSLYRLVTAPFEDQAMKPEVPTAGPGQASGLVWAPRA